MLLRNTSTSRERSHTSPRVVGTLQESTLLVLVKKIRKQLLARNGHGIQVLSPSYVMLERSVEPMLREPNGRIRTRAELKRWLRKSTALGLTDDELDSWMYWCLAHEDSATNCAGHTSTHSEAADTLDVVNFFLQLRYALRCTQQQVDDVVLKLRNAWCRRQGNGIRGVGEQDVEDDLETFLSETLPVIEKELLMNFMESDWTYLCDMLASEVPADIVYPCLLRKLLDSVLVLDGSKPLTGTIGLLKCFRFVPTVDAATFQSVMERFGSGLSTIEVARIFEYCAVPGGGDELILHTHAFLKILRSKIQEYTLGVLDASSAESGVVVRNVSDVEASLPCLREALSRALAHTHRSTPFPMVYIHTQLVALFHQHIEHLFLALQERTSKWGNDGVASPEEDEYDDLPIMLKFAELLRSHGVLATTVPDIALELLWCYGDGDYTALMDVLLGDFAPTREKVVREVWFHLCNAHIAQHDISNKLTPHSSYPARSMKDLNDATLEYAKPPFACLPTKYLTDHYRSSANHGTSAAPPHAEFASFLHAAYSITTSIEPKDIAHCDSPFKNNTATKHNEHTAYQTYCLYWRCISQYIESETDFITCIQSITKVYF